MHPFQLSLIAAQERAADARRRAEADRRAARAVAAGGVQGKQRSRVIESLLRIRTPAES